MLASLVLSFGVQTYTIRRMDRIVDSMEDRDEEIVLALDLRSAIGELDRRHEELSRRRGEGLEDYEEAMHRELTLLQRLDQHTHEPRSAAALAAVRQASSELDRLFSEQVSSTPDDPGRASPSPDAGHLLVVRLQEGIDRYLADLRASVDSSRRDLEFLEGASTWWLAAVL